MVNLFSIESITQEPFDFSHGRFSRLALKYEAEDADKTIKDIETDIKDKMYKKRHQQEGGE